ncbi:MAG: inositol monophosphatase family protein [Planctomycetota bacterium]|jgi:myo-inositol-1(or 4)-monophosphatase
MLKEEKEVAIRAVKEAGKIILSFQERDKSVETKGLAYNLVTEADLQSERAIVSIIQEKFSGHSILAEEKESSMRDSQYIWVIDPLDGTNNYAHGFPHFSVSIALWSADTPLIGVAYDPLRDELFYAQKGQGAFLNDQPISVTSRATLPESILATGFYYDRGRLMKRTLQQMEAFFNIPIQGVRRTGSAVLDMCYVAAGRLDGFWELILSPWDYAASSLIVTEAGGKVTDINGNELNLYSKNVLVSNGLIHDAMLRVVKQ